MTPEEFAAKMREIRRHDDDPEAAHGDADQLMTDLLRSLGYSEGVAEFDQMRKWYA
jgi:hypothetical protein